MELFYYVPYEWYPHYHIDQITGELIQCSESIHEELVRLETLQTLFQEESYEEYINNLYPNDGKNGSIHLKKRKLEYDNSVSTKRFCKKVSTTGINTACSICQNIFKKNEIIRQTCTKCAFHAKCIDPWFNMGKNKCPNCCQLINFKTDINSKCQ